MGTQRWRAWIVGGALAVGLIASSSMARAEARFGRVEPTVAQSWRSAGSAWWSSFVAWIDGFVWRDEGNIIPGGNGGGQHGSVVPGRGGLHAVGHGGS